MVKGHCGLFSDTVQESQSGTNMLEDQAVAGMETTLE